MAECLLISEVKFSAALPDDVDAGLLGWVSCTLNESLRLDGIALRRSADRRLVLSFPSRRDRAGREHPIIRPLDDTARLEIEHQVFGALGLEEGVQR